MDARRLMKKSDERRAHFIKGARRVIEEKIPQDKLLIGPVKGVLMSATDLCKKVLVGEDDIFLYPHHGPVCRLLSDSKAHVKAFMREAARQMVWDRLAEQMEESQPRRKDLAGMTDLVNVKATMAPSKLDPPALQCCE